MTEWTTAGKNYSGEVEVLLAVNTKHPRTAGSYLQLQINSDISSV